MIKKTQKKDKNAPENTGDKRQYIPEITSLPNRYLFNPWEAPGLVLKGVGIELGSAYPNPVVDLKQSGEPALIAFHSLKQGGS